MKRTERASALLIPTLALALLVLVLLGFVLPAASEVFAGSEGALLVEIGRAARPFLEDCLTLLRAQPQLIGFAALLALIPALAGAIFRDSFRNWFAAAFGLIVVIDTVSFLSGTGSMVGGHLESLHHSYGRLLAIEAALLLVFLGFRLRPASSWPNKDLKPGEEKEFSGRYIVVCIDGTWNYPGQTDLGEGADTNVFKIWRAMKGEETYKAHPNANRAKLYRGEGTKKQLALYYSGVGNPLENSQLGQMFGGGFGLGAESIKERAYLDIVRAYYPGDRICIFGFSRGAAIARVLANTLRERGLPKKVWTIRVLGRHHPVWTSPERWEGDVGLLGCFDTVGSFGLAKNFLGIPFQRINLLKNFEVSTNVLRAYHMVALDESRDAFEPTLMDPDPSDGDRVNQVWFAGNHSNIGGGYKTDGLSDVALDYLLSQISSGYQTDEDRAGDETWGPYLKATRVVIRDGQIEGDLDLLGETLSVCPAPYGIVRHEKASIYKYAPRRLPLGAKIHESVFERMQIPGCRYVPESLFALGRRLDKMRRKIERQVGFLSDHTGTETVKGTLSPEESEKILAWARRVEIDRVATGHGRPNWNTDLLNPGTDVDIFDVMLSGPDSD